MFEENLEVISVHMLFTVFVKPLFIPEKKPFIFPTKPDTPFPTPVIPPLKNDLIPVHIALIVLMVPVPRPEKNPFNLTTNPLTPLATEVIPPLKNVFEFMSNPGDLVKNVISKFVDYDGMSGIALSMGKGLVGKVTGGMGDWVKKLFESDTGSPPGKGVERWRPTVAKALSMNGLPATDAYIGAWLRQISSESGGNEKAVQGNIGDINNKTGDLAKGLVQVIGQTFNAYKFPGHNNRLNGLDSLLAGINYAKSRYGKDGMLNVIGKGHGYANGGLVNRHQFAEIAEGNKPEMVIPLTRKNRAVSLIQKAQSILGMDDENPTVRQQSAPNNNDREMINVLKSQVELLRAILAKSGDVLIDGKKVGDILDKNNGRRIQDAEGKVFV